MVNIASQIEACSWCWEKHVPNILRHAQISICYSASAALLSCSTRQDSVCYVYDDSRPANTAWRRVNALMLHWKPSLGTLLNGHRDCPPVHAGSRADVHMLVFTNNHVYSAPLTYILRYGDGTNQHVGSLVHQPSHSCATQRWVAPRKPDVTCFMIFLPAVLLDVLTTDLDPQMQGPMVCLAQGLVDEGGTIINPCILEQAEATRKGHLLYNLKEVSNHLPFPFWYHLPHLSISKQSFS